MTTTPPLRPLADQPATPLHGARFDVGDLSSVRRSTRFSDRGAARTPSPTRQSISPQSGSLSSPRRTRKANPSFTYSPPSSPSSPPTMARKRGSGGRSKIAHALNGNGADNHSTNAAAAGMLPTPAKTPSRKDNKKAGLSSTARVLFPKGPDPQDDPTPTRKRAKKNFGYSAVSWGDGANSDEKIEIFTDSKEQLPEVDESADNPFYEKNGKTGRGKKAKPAAEAKNAVHEVLKQDEGMIYVFRGKKLYRKFEPDNDDKPPHNLDSATDGLALNELESPRHFTRSSVKPRLLFPTSQPQRYDATDDEATTEVEDAVVQEVAGTPSKSNFHPATPPETAKTKRTTARMTGPDSSPVTEYDVPPPRFTGKRTEKPSPFQDWSRVKPGPNDTPTAKGKKRGADAMEQGEGSGKRFKSNALPR